MKAKLRLEIVAYALRSGVPLILQGPTSASKSLTAQAAAIGIFGQPPLIHALSEQTEVGDLLGRKLFRRHGTTLLKFVPGVLTRAYHKGRVLLLDEFDLCPPKVLSSILAALDGSTIEINGLRFTRHPNFRLIATLNGETEGFSPQQRNILPADVLARFQTSSFRAMERSERDEIFQVSLPAEMPRRDLVLKLICDLHEAVARHFAIQAEGHRDYTRGAAVMTMRNFNAAMAMITFEKQEPREACRVAYLSQLPSVERAQYPDKLEVLGVESANVEQSNHRIILKWQLTLPIRLWLKNLFRIKNPNRRMCSKKACAMSVRNSTTIEQSDFYPFQERKRSTPSSLTIFSARHRAWHLFSLWQRSC
jgi:hypothetical protein